MLLVPLRVISSPSSTTLPPLCVRLLASRVPLFFTKPACNLFNATPDKIISPSGAAMACRFSISVCSVEAVVVMPANPPWLFRFSVICSPEAKATVPARATITPLFCTSGASKAT